MKFSFNDDQWAYIQHFEEACPLFQNKLLWDYDTGIVKAGIHKGKHILAVPLSYWQQLLNNTLATAFEIYKLTLDIAANHEEMAAGKENE